MGHVPITIDNLANMDKISIVHAFMAMKEFIDEFVSRQVNGELPGGDYNIDGRFLLDGMHIDDDGHSGDPAFLGDWLNAVERARSFIS